MQALRQQVDDLTAKLYGKPISKMTPQEAIAAGLITGTAVGAIIMLAGPVVESAAIFFTADTAVPFLLGTTAAGIAIAVQPVIGESNHVLKRSFTSNRSF